MAVTLKIWEFTSYYGGAEWSPMVAFIILIVALLFRPQGLLGKGA